MLEERVHSSSIFRFRNLSNQGGVDHFVSTRIGGLSLPPYESLNLGFHVGDCPETVLKNRERLAADIEIPLSDFTLARQIHSGTVTIVTEQMRGYGAVDFNTAIEETDAMVTSVPGLCLSGTYGGLCAGAPLRSPKTGRSCRTCRMARVRQTDSSENGRNLTTRIQLSTH